ncbi:hypothetical protein GWD55_00490 [Staphylococcus pseudintermedius]|nr:hypothetical protein [Staphylococcus pseudintermedius]
MNKCDKVSIGNALGEIGVCMKRSAKIFATLLSSVILLEVGSVSGGQVIAATNSQKQLEKEQQEYIKFKEAWINAIESTPPSEFKDPKVKEELKKNIKKSEERGKVTITAKAAAKGIKALMKKTGRAGWDAVVRKVENSTGTELVMFHYDQVTNIVNLLANSQEKAQTAISKILVNNFGFNKTVANAVAYTFVLIVL